MEDKLMVLEVENKLSKEKTQEELEALEDLKVGFELEMCNAKEMPFSRGDLVSTIGKEMDWCVEKGNMKLYTETVNAGELGKIQIKRVKDQFMEHETVGYIYVDGSVPLEIATNQFKIDMQTIREKLAEIYNPFITSEKDIFKTTRSMLMSSLPELRCGQHQNFAFTHRKRQFKDIVIANVIQLGRLFAPTMFYLFSCGSPQKRTRSMEFRYINEAGHRTTATEKYSWIHNKSGVEIEFRYPDGNMSMVIPALMAMANKMLIVKATKFSEFGILYMKTELFKKIEAFNAAFLCREELSEKMMEIASENMDFFFKFFKEEMSKKLEMGLKAMRMKPVWKHSFQRTNWESWKRIDNEYLAAYRMKDEDDDLMKSLKMKTLMISGDRERQTGILKAHIMQLKPDMTEAEVKDYMDKLVWNEDKLTFKRRD